MSNVYRKIPVKIKAVQWKGDNFAELSEFCPSVREARTVNNMLMLDTLEGVMYVQVNDYVIQGVRGEFYPCKPDIFRCTYERINEFDQVIDFEEDVLI
jgi:hypothetical protein